MLAECFEEAKRTDQCDLARAGPRVFVQVGLGFGSYPGQLDNAEERLELVVEQP